MKKYFVLLSLLVMTANVLGHEDVNARDKAILKFFGPLIAAGIVKTACDKASENESMTKLGKAVGLNPKDISKVGAVVSFFGAQAACQTDEDLKETFLYMATRLPFVASGMAIAFNRTFQKCLKNVYIVGDFVSCDNTDCTGTCNECLLTKGTVGYGVGKSLCIMLDWGIEKFKNRNKK